MTGVFSKLSETRELLTGGKVTATNSRWITDTPICRARHSERYEGFKAHRKVRRTRQKNAEIGKILND